ncbi:MAG: 16S rRNA (cytidine(1402)-2'-O)-methyltransferase [Actinomycetota bacterium]
MGGVLHLVGTPIGNLGDMSERAREVLASVDLVAAEDTRRTGLLLQRFGLRARTTSFFEGNERERTQELLQMLRDGLEVAVVSDAGMPGISDPGYRLVRACADEGIDVRVVPGPSAVIAALVVSGLPTDRFSFEGFLPRKHQERVRRLTELAQDRRTLVCFESPRRVVTALRDAVEVFGDRRMALVRELTKLHEEVLRGTISEVLERLSDRELKGELVVVFEGASPQELPDVSSLVEQAGALIANGTRRRAAAQEVARAHGVSANDLYRALLSADETEG